MDSSERQMRNDPADQRTETRQMQESYSGVPVVDLQRSTEQKSIPYSSAVSQDYLARPTSPYDMSSMAHMLPAHAVRQQYPSPSTQPIPHGPATSPPYSYPYPMHTLPAQTLVPYPPQYRSHSGLNTYGAAIPQQQYTGQSRGHLSIYAQSYTNTHASRSGANYLPSGVRSRPLSNRTQALHEPMNTHARPMVGYTRPEAASASASGLRGPPRKPKQSGHALWVGNLPSGTPIMELKDHFSREATDDIESVFLIAKSNCAFVNYRSEASCAAAMARFHDSRFRGVRLVCRLRKGSTNQNPPGNSPINVDTVEASDSQTGSPNLSLLSDVGVELGTTIPNIPPMEKEVKERFFVVKSLTLDDLERSVQNGVWATQAHNEENLNKAFATAEDVYLIFSANKSGEYFGYARMDSLVGDESVPEGLVPSASRLAGSSVDAADAPRLTPTPATATAPKGHVIDDLARGTIFWEAEKAATVLPPSSTDGEINDLPGEDDNRSSGQTTFGKPFRVVWQSTERLPFYRTRGLRNPWNANREVKIARDGTELEPGVGRKLLGLFEQQAQINAALRNGPTQPFGFSAPPMYQGGQTAYGYVSSGVGYVPQY